MVSRRVLKRWHPRLVALVTELHGKGYAVVHGGKHVGIRHPSGRRVATIAVTPSDHRAQLNCIANIRRAIADIA